MTDRAGRWVALPAAFAGLLTAVTWAGDPHPTRLIPIVLGACSLLILIAWAVRQLIAAYRSTVTWSEQELAELDAWKRYAERESS